jgi:hypothetical protein
MTHSEKLLLVVCQNPEDWHLRLILADAYEEENNTMYAECQRWLARHHKRALNCYAQKEAVAWFDAGRVSTQTDPESNLPEILFSLLAENKRKSHLLRFESRQESEKVVMRAFPVAITRGWNPTESVEQENDTIG